MRVCRPYQEDAYAATLRELERVTSTILVLPTGTGKTVILAKLAANWNRGNVLLLAHRTELLEQARDKFGAELGYLPVIEQAERGMEPDCLWRGGLVLVASVQTMRNDKRLEKFRNHPFDLVRDRRGASCRGKELPQDC
jgi:superfamily II DNA or RNA helicase